MFSPKGSSLEANVGRHGCIKQLFGDLFACVARIGKEQDFFAALCPPQVLINHLGIMHSGRRQKALDNQFADGILPGNVPCFRYALHCVFCPADINILVAFLHRLIVPLRAAFAFVDYLIVFAAPSEFLAPLCRNRSDFNSVVGRTLKVPPKRTLI